MGAAGAAPSLEAVTSSPANNFFAIGTVAEAELSFVLANAYLEKFGHDNMADIRAALAEYRQRLKMQSR